MLSVTFINFIKLCNNNVRFCLYYDPLRRDSFVFKFILFQCRSSGRTFYFTLRWLFSAIILAFLETFVLIKQLNQLLPLCTHSVFDIGHCTVIHCDARGVSLVDQWKAEKKWYSFNWPIARCFLKPINVSMIIDTKPKLVLSTNIGGPCNFLNTSITSFRV